MRRVRYQVACSLDGYIAGPNGEFDWIIADPEIDFSDLFAQFDTLLMGRRTFEAIPNGAAEFQDMHIVVFSTTLRQEDHPHATIVSANIEQKMNELRAAEGKDIWLFGGGELFRTLWDLGHVDSVEPAIIPVLIGGGVPFLPAPAVRRQLELRSHRIYQSGIVLLEYVVPRAELRMTPHEQVSR
jgi:dihydrofolate reductase